MRIANIDDKKKKKNCARSSDGSGISILSWKRDSVWKHRNT